MLCFRRKNFWGPSHGSATLSSPSGGGNNPKNGLITGSRKMAPPPNVAHAVHPILREVTEDTPPDLLEGTMDLLVVLPSKKSVRMTVNRRTPMMDLLIQVTTANKIIPGGHIVQIRNERGIELPYKPSTPIGALDTTQIDIVPKKQVNEYIIVKKQTAKIANQPFEQTFRLQVHLPRNQLFLMRVGPKTLLADILQEVCREKNLDYTKYEMRHPVKLDEKLSLDRRIGDFGLQEVTIVSRNSRINSSVSTADIMALQNEEGRTKGLDSAFKHSRSSVGDSSVSSESAASARGISPSRSDDSRSISPLPHQIRPKLKLNATMSNASSSSGTSSAVPKNHQLVKTSTSLNGIVQAPPRPKKRAAPLPPTLVSPTSTCSLNGPTHKDVVLNVPVSPVNDNNCIRQTTSIVSPPVRPTPRKKDPPKEPPLPINHSRHSSDSSGYHESCVVCEHQDSQMHRFDRQQSVPAIGNLSNLPRVSGCHSVSNLTTVSSISSTSLASSNGGQRKRKAPKPPTIPFLQAQNEIEEDCPLPVSTTSVDSKHEINQTQTTINSIATHTKSTTLTTTRHISTRESPSPINNNKNLSREEIVEVKVDVHTYQDCKETRGKEQKEEEEQEERIVKSEVIKNTFENHSSSEPTSSLESSLPLSSASSLSSSPGSSQGSTSSSPIPTTTNLVGESNSESSQVQERIVPQEQIVSEKHSNLSSSSAIKESSEGQVENLSSESVQSRPVLSVENMSRPVSSPSPVMVEDNQPVASRNNAHQVVDVQDIQDDTVLLSSESEASYTDSGIPATETITPSPDMMDRSEKDISSNGSSRRSSIHSLEQPENENALRELLQAKIEKEQEIIDKAFEGIEVDDEDKEGGIVNNNFDFAQTPSMTNLLHKNNVTSSTSSPNPPSEDEEREVEDDGAYSSSSNDEEKELKFSSGADEDSLQTSSKLSKKSAPGRKLPKSESFSHKSEYDAVKMKRKLFSKEGKMNAVLKTYVSSSDEDLTAGRVHAKGKDQSGQSKSVGRTGSMQNLSSVNNSGHNGSRANQLDMRTKASGNSQLVNNRRNSPPSTTNDGFRKANSVLSFQDLDPDISQNPELLASIRSELESQFEQWKEQFLQKHLAGSKSSSFDTDSEPTTKLIEKEEEEEEDVVDHQSKSNIALESPKVKGEEDPVFQNKSDVTELVVKSKDETVITTKVQVHSQEKTPSQEKPLPISHSPTTQDSNILHSLVTPPTKELESVENSSPSLNESSDSFKPQVVHSVPLTKSTKDKLREEEQVEKFSTSQISQSSPLVDSVKDSPHIVETLTQTKQDMPVESKERKSHEETDEMVQLREKKPVTLKPVDSDDEPKIYRYTGPPTINLGTWGDRPQRSVSVKRDNDYIMGMGQFNSKANEGRQPALGSVAKRIHSFVSPVTATTPPLTKPSVATTTTNPSSNNDTTTNQPPPTRPKSISAIYTMNAMSSSSTESMTNNKNSVGSPVSNVVTSWKQRLEQSEKERQNSHATPQNSIDISEPDSHIILNEQSPSPSSNSVNSSLERIKKSKFENNNNNTTNNLSRPPTMVQSNNVTNGNTQKSSVKISSYGETRKFHPLTSSFHNNNNQDNDTASDYSSSSNSRPASSNASTSNIVIASMSDSTSSSPLPTNGSSSGLSEKKKFFQGVKPVEPGKEAPIPAQNLKGNIASIQKVFEQHQQQKMGNHNGSLPGSGTNSTTSPFTSKESSPAPSIPFSTTSSQSSAPSISSTMMVQKVMKAGSFNMDNFRRTPSPSTSSLSSISSKSESERHTPSPTEGAIRISTSTNRISTGNNFETSRQQQQPVAELSGGGNIKNVGNKSIIIVGSSDVSNHLSNNNIFKQQLKVTAAAPTPNITAQPNPVVNNNNSTKVNINGAYNSNPNLKIQDKNETTGSSSSGVVKLNGRENGNVILKKTPTLTTQETAPTPTPISTGKVSSIAANLTSNNNFFSSLQRQSKQPEKVTPSPSKSMQNGDKPIIIEQLEKPRKFNMVESTSAAPASKNVPVKGPSRNFEIVKRNSVTDIQPGPAAVIPPPPPMDKLETKRPASLGLANNGSTKSLSAGSPGSKITSPTSPTSDPRSEIFDSIKNANFVLRKTNSTMLLK